MSIKVTKSVVFIFLFAGLVALAWHALKPPHESVAKTEGAPPVIFKGGPGNTPASAVLVAQAPDYVAVVDGEYQYLGKKFGQRGRDWRLVKKQVYQHDAKVYDLITIKFSKGARQQFFFDITKYFKKP